MECKLKERRNQLGLTLKQVATYIGVSESTVSRWETGNIKNMREKHITKMSEILHVSTLLIKGLPLETLHIEFQCRLQDVTKNYLDLSNDFFGEAQKVKNIIHAEARLINSLDNLTEEQFDEITKYVDYIKYKK